MDLYNVSDSTSNYTGNYTRTFSENSNFILPEKLYDVISYDTYKKIVTMSDCVLMPVIFVVGVPTNVVTCLVLYRQGLKDRMNLCLFVLVLVEIVHLCVLLTQSAKTFVEMVNKKIGIEYSARVTLYIGGPALALKAVINCISVVISVERCVCVAFPLKAGVVMGTRTMAMLLVGIIASMLLIHIFFPLKYVVTYVDNDIPDLSNWILVPSNFFIESSSAFHIVDDILVSTILPVTSFIVVSAATTVTVVQLKLAMAWRAGSVPGDRTNSQNSEVSLTKMLVLLSCIYIVCASPKILLALTRLLVSEFRSAGRYHNLYWALHYLAAAWAAVNSGINFFVYRRSVRFRNALHLMFQRKDKGEKNETQVTSGSRA